MNILKKIKENKSEYLSKNFIIFLVIGIIISYICFTMISLLFKTPIILIFGFILAYMMNNVYKKRQAKKKVKSI